MNPSLPNGCMDTTTNSLLVRALPPVLTCCVSEYNKSNKSEPFYNKQEDQQPVQEVEVDVPGFEQAFEPSKHAEQDLANDVYVDDSHTSDADPGSECNEVSLARCFIL